MSGCKVYSSDLLGDMLSASRADESEEDSLLYPPAGVRRPPQSLAMAQINKRKAAAKAKARESRKIAAQQEAKKVMRNKAYWSRMNKLQEESERQVREKLEVMRAQKEKRFEEMMGAIASGEDYTRQVDEMLAFHDQMELRKRIARYNEWHDNVFSKIQESVRAKTERDAAKLRKIRAREYEKFLQETNEKDSLFLDIIIASSYDPFVVNRHAVRADVGQLDDPTHRVISRQLAEQQMIPGAGEALTPQPSRGSLPVAMWAAGKVESTPHGYFAKLMQDQSPTRGVESAVAGATQSRSSIDMNHFDFPRGRTATDAEFPRGKRTDFSYLNKH